MKKQTIFTQIAIIIAIIIVSNILSSQLYFRLDFTEDKKYTLSEATKDILKNLDEVITVYAYFSEDLPSQLLSNRRDFEDFLIEYEQVSEGNVVYEFVNPNEDSDIEREVNDKGIGPIMINVRENDRVEQLRAYMGAVLQIGSEKEIIPIIQPGTAIEFELTSAIKKLSVKNKPKVAILKGHGETPLESISQLEQQLEVLYDVESYEISDSAFIPSEYRTIAILAPSDTIPQSHIDKLKAYYQAGGSLFIAYSNVQGNLETRQLKASPDIGLTGFLNDIGVEIGNSFVIDAQCGNIGIQQRQGLFVINSQVQLPHFPRITNFEDHPITTGIEDLIFLFASSVTSTIEDSSTIVTPLLYTSPKSGIVSTPWRLDVEKKWDDTDFDKGTQTLGLAISNEMNPRGNLVVIANGDFYINGKGDRARQLPPDYTNLVSNAMDWLSDDTGLIKLRTKGISSRPLETVEDSTKEILKYANVFAPILLLLVYALIRRLNNQKKRQRWMEGKL